jgi:aspartyl-tRNA(Asn)/glutamyl-tRNA(Gln) amidotransferase subunit A
MADSRELLSKPVSEISSLVRSGQVSPVELVQSTLERIESLEPRLNACITILGEQAMLEANAAERAIQAGQYLGPYHGIPVGIKDLLMTRGILTTGGSGAFADFVPDSDATTVTKLKKAGAIIVAKHNLHELGMGASNNNYTFGATHNPWKQGFIPGGSSGGTAAAVAASECYAGLGTDTGASIRMPAACCGIVGLMPTYGRVSRYGVIALSWSLDHVGPITRTVTDAAILLNVIAGYDPLDASTKSIPVPDYALDISAGVQGLRVGIPRNYYNERVHPEVEAAVHRAIQTLVELGATPVDITIPDLEHAYTAEVTIGFSEAASYHEHQLRERADQYAPDVRAALEAGEMISATKYLKAQRLRTLIKHSFRMAMQQVDVIATPTLPTPAVPIEQDTVMFDGEEESLLKAMIRFTCPIDLSGQPAIAVPCGFTKDGLPISLQLIGRPYEETTICRAARAYEAATEWHTNLPQV